eukprot:3757673-Rhodomonas_salina.1
METKRAVMCLVLLSHTLQERAMEEKGRAGKALRQCVSDVERPSTLDQREHSVPDQVPHEIVPDVDVLREFAIHWVVGDGYASCIVLPHNRGFPLFVPKSS